MSKFLLISCIMFTIYSQIKIDIHRSVLNDEILMAIEKDIIENVISLHNKNERETISYKFVDHDSFEELFTGWNDFETNRKHLVINSITINDERKITFDFSSPYLPIRQALIAKKDSNQLVTINTKTVGYVTNSTQESLLKILPKEYTFVSFPTFEQLGFALLNENVDLMFGDNVGIWANKEKYIYSYIDESYDQSYGIMYKKDSPLKKRLDKYLRYYTKSKSFHRLIRKSFGKSISEYMIKQLKAY